MIQFIRKKFQNLISDQKFSEILTGSAWALSARIIATVLGLAFNVLVARLYGADVVGILAVINSFLMLSTIFTVLGTNTSILRLIPEHLVKYSPTSAFKVYRKTQYMIISISVVTALLFFYSANLISDKIFSKPHLSYYFALASVFIVFKSMMTLNTQAVRGLRLIKLFALMQFLPQTTNLCFLIVVGLLWPSQDVPVYAIMFGFAMTGIAGWLIMEIAFKKRMQPIDKVQPIRWFNILSISFPILMTSIMLFMINQTGVIMLGIFRSDAEVGYYAIALKLATLTTFIISAVNSMAGPIFSKLFHSDKIDELFLVAKKSAKLIFWTTLPILICLAFLGAPILRIGFGNEFVVAYPILLLLALGQFFDSISGATNLFMHMTGNQNMYRNIIFVVTSMHIALSFIVIPKYGAYGAAIATTFSLVSLNIITLIYLKIKFGKTTAYIPFKKSCNQKLL